MLRQVMRPGLRPVMTETFRDIDYMVSSSEDGTGDADDVQPEDLVSKRFERGWQSFTLPIKRLMTERNYDRLTAQTISHLATTLEKRLWSFYGRVNELGAVRLERDISGIVAAATRGGRYELRDAFARCVQMTLIINMEDEEWEEISNLNGAQLDRESGLEWKLDAGERKRVRGIVKESIRDCEITLRSFYSRQVLPQALLTGNDTDNLAVYWIFAGHWGPRRTEKSIYDRETIDLHTALEFRTSTKRFVPAGRLMLK
nr:conserved oligomeric golgi complex subunit 4 [Quercus suber]